MDLIDFRLPRLCGGGGFSQDTRDLIIVGLLQIVN